MTRTVLHALHAGAWACCYGALTYTYFRLNDQMRRFTSGEASYEAFAGATAQGLHRWLMGALIVAGTTGALLLLWAPARADSSPWWGLVGVKVAVLVALSGMQVWLTAVLWPRRRAAKADAAAEQRRFYRFTFLMGFFLLVQLTLGTLLPMVRER